MKKDKSFRQSFRQVDQHIVPRARSSHHPIRKITGTFPSTSLLGYGCMNCGEISRVRSDVYMCSCQAPQIIIAPHPSALKRGTSHIHHDSHIGVCFSSSFRTMFWVLSCPLLNEKSLKSPRKTENCQWLSFFEPKEDFNHLDYDRSGLLEPGLVRLANGASRSSDQ